MGLSQTLLRWIHGYLANRHMRTKFNNCMSECKPLVCGVPQGSVIGPILFLCYIIDIVKISEENNTCISLYADDAVIFATGNNSDELSTKLQSSLNDISLWCDQNRINLNVQKTKLCCYGRRCKLKQFKILLKFRDKNLNQCHQYNYLGITLDETMNLETNFNNIFKKFSYKVFQFTKIRRFLPEATRILVYKQTILPLVEYVSYMLFFNRKIDVDKFQKLQNRALHMCFDIYDPRDISLVDLHKNAKLLTLQARRDIHLINLMFDLRDVEGYINVPVVETRQANKIIFKLDRADCDVYKRSPYNVGGGLWNDLPAEIQLLENKMTFKDKIRLIYSLQ